MGVAVFPVVRPAIRRSLEQADAFRIEATTRLDPQKRSLLGQFLTPASLARFMAGFFENFGDRVRLLDAGAGVGTLVAATVAEACSRPVAPRSVDVAAFEIDRVLARYLRETLESCKAESRAAGVRFRGAVTCEDFVEACVGGRTRFTHAILNPPYRKLASNSKTRLLVRDAGIETTNLYAAFVALAVKRLEPGGELVAITPRSFCNGPYFRHFREFLLRETSLVRVHLFGSRTATFADDAVLQENLVIHVVKGRRQGKVILSGSSGKSPEASDPLSVREALFDQVVLPGDPQRFFHIAPDALWQETADAFARLPARLVDLGLSVSTGKVVDFRARAFLRREPGRKTGPLVYATHFSDGFVRWPKAGKKPNALLDARGTAGLWMPRGTYVLVKRFSSKEERRRIVAAVFDPELVPAEKVGFENHLNVFHRLGGGLEEALARGLATFLNSTIVDLYFRQWSGHTQVNATDLRSLRYPSMGSLERLGRRVGDRTLSQEDVDNAVESLLGAS